MGGFSSSNADYIGYKNIMSEISSGLSSNSVSTYTSTKISNESKVKTESVNFDEEMKAKSKDDYKKTADTAQSKNSNIDKDSIEYQLISEFLKGTEYGALFEENGALGGDVLESALGQLFEGDADSNALKKIVLYVMQEKIDSGKEAIGKYDFGDLNSSKDDILTMYNSLSDYIVKNVGNLSYDGMIDAIAPSMRNILVDAAKKQGAPGFIVDGVTSDAINKELNKYFDDPSNKAKMKSIIGEIMSGNTDNISTTLTEMGNEVFWDTLEDYYPKRYFALKTLQNVSSGASSAWEGFKDGVSNVGNAIGDFFSDPFGTIGGWFS